MFTTGPRSSDFCKRRQKVHRIMCYLKNSKPIHGLFAPTLSLNHIVVRVWHKVRDEGVNVYESRTVVWVPD